MSGQRYEGGVVAGIIKSRGIGAWPEEIPGLGPMVRTVNGRCVDCDAAAKRSGNPQYAIDGGWITYGGVHLCRRHAQLRAAGPGAAPGVRLGGGLETGRVR